MHEYERTCGQQEGMVHKELARIDHFQFRATKLVVTFSARDDTEHAGISRDLSVNDKRLLFEGFDWK